MKELIIMTEEYWRNSQFSVARFHGGINFNMKRYSIVNKDGQGLQKGRARMPHVPSLPSIGRFRRGECSLYSDRAYSHYLCNDWKFKK